MKKSEIATKWMEDLATNDIHGYDQTNRWGPDYDCSSAVISAYEQAGVPVKSNGATYTGNMYNVFLKSGFLDVTKEINFTNGSGLKRGDVLLNSAKHTAMYCGNGKEVEASINEKGTITGGKTGDQTGKEILIRNYRNYPWTSILRFQEIFETDDKKVSYTVKKGDTLYKISKENEFTVRQLKDWNNIKDENIIYPGQIIYFYDISMTKNINVKVSINDLYLRDAPNGKILCFCPAGCYSIVSTKVKNGYTWGKLLSGAGWIALDYTTKY